MALGEEEVRRIEGWFDVMRLETNTGEEPKYADLFLKVASQGVLI